MAFTWNGNNNQVLKIEVTYADHIKTDPPSGELRVTNLWVKDSNKKLQVEYDDEPVE